MFQVLQQHLNILETKYQIANISEHRKINPKPAEILGLCNLCELHLCLCRGEGRLHLWEQKNVLNSVCE